MAEWISVEDKMPSDCGCDWVLVSIVEKNGFRWIPKVAEYRPQYRAWRVESEEIRWLYENGTDWLKVTHWHPLPKPPQEG